MSTLLFVHRSWISSMPMRRKVEHVRRNAFQLKTKNYATHCRCRHAIPRNARSQAWCSAVSRQLERCATLNQFRYHPQQMETGPMKSRPDYHKTSRAIVSINKDASQNTRSMRRNNYREDLDPEKLDWLVRLSHNWKRYFAVNRISDSKLHTKASSRIRRRACLGKPRSINSYIWQLVESKLVEQVLVGEITMDKEWWNLKVFSFLDSGFRTHVVATAVCATGGVRVARTFFSHSFCEQHISHVTFSRWFTFNDTHMCGSIRKFGVRSAHFTIISCVIFMRSCCVFDSPRFLHFPLYAVYLLSYRPVFLLGHQFLLPRCGEQIPCALQLMREGLSTLAEYDSHRFWAQRLPHLGDYWTLHPGIFQR